jgi:Putative MetA-pathway of phenol degradation
MRSSWLSITCFAIVLMAKLPVHCQEIANQPDSFAERYFARVDKTQAEQPHWITPVATTTPRLEQEFRYDIFWQTNAKGITAENYAGGKGLELIPLEKVELIFSPPPYLVHHNPRVADGFGDLSFLVKYRLLSANEQHGNYILTAFLGVSLPTGDHSNGALHAILTPTMAYGKGFGQFDFQGTIGVALPAADAHRIGRTVTWNNAFQYRIFRKLWPEVEINATFFQDGPSDGKKQVFITPGLVVGRLHLWRRAGVTVGGGFQIAATRFHSTNHNGIISLRLPF